MEPIEPAHPARVYVRDRVCASVCVCEGACVSMCASAHAAAVRNILYYFFIYFLITMWLVKENENPKTECVY